MKGYLVECHYDENNSFTCFFRKLEFVKWYVDFEKKFVKSDIQVYKVDVSKLEKVQINESGDIKIDWN